MLKQLIFRKNLNFVLLLALGYPLTLLATSETITINSDSAEFDNKLGQATHRGHVVMTKTNQELIADTLIIEKDAEGKIKLMTAYGKPAYFHVETDPEKPHTEGKADIIKYYPNENKMILLEDAELKQTNENIQGPLLIYDLSTKILTSKASPHKRTLVTLNPKTTSSPTP